MSNNSQADRRREYPRHRSGPSLPRQDGPNGTTCSDETGGRKVIQLREVKLRKADYPWRPFFEYKRGPPGGSDVTKKVTLYRKVQGILNKLTPEKFPMLTQQFLDLKIETEEQLEGVVEIVFENALLSSQYVVAFANLCKHGMVIKVNSRAENNPVSFRKLLLNRCQKEFEGGDFWESCLAVTRDNMHHEDISRPQRKAERISAAKQRYKANLRFFGELFKLKMLTESIMHDSISKLLHKWDDKKDSHDEAAMECLSEFLDVIGKYCKQD